MLGVEEQEIIGLGSMGRLWIVGETVRRERGPHSDTIAALLKHLEKREYPYSPHYLGVDEHGRDILSRVPGAPVPTLRGDKQLIDVGQAVAGFADAVRDFRAPSNATWRNPEGWPLHGDTVIHNDIAPWNMLENEVAGAPRLSGLVDFDSARPGRAIEDVAYAAWHMVPLHDEPMGDGAPPPPLTERPRRLRLFADACELTARQRARLVDEVARVQVTQAARVAAGALGDEAETSHHWNNGRFAANTARSLLWLDRHRNDLEQALRAL
ncbi:phosphotransferase [Nocardiopsis sp. HNM0947]|uniref:Phosphotransferase n=1 Tax=Nocardiopsis coralli TaxID=2772213 RepID=A0ABR9P8H1_9ACTN|nr:phosphotransferase [Nocardiopsis coralli]